MWKIEMDFLCRFKQNKPLFFLSLKSIRLIHRPVIVLPVCRPTSASGAVTSSPAMTGVGFELLLDNKASVGYVQSPL